MNHLQGIRTSQPKLWRQRSPAEVVAAEIHKWYEVTRILNASPHDWCPPVPNAAWVEQQASVRLPCQRAERHRALLVAHPVPNALRHTLCPTPLGWRPRAASFTMELLLSPEALRGERGQNAFVAHSVLSSDAMPRGPCLPKRARLLDEVSIRVNGRDATERFWMLLLPRKHVAEPQALR